MQPITGLWSLAHLAHEYPTILTIDVTPKSPPFRQKWTIDFRNREDSPRRFDGVQAREVIDKLGRSYEQIKSGSDWTIEDHLHVLEEAHAGNVYEFPLPWKNDPNYDWFVLWLTGMTERAMPPYRVSDSNRHRFVVDHGRDGTFDWRIAYEVRPDPYLYENRDKSGKILASSFILSDHEVGQTSIAMRHSLNRLGYEFELFGYKAEEYRDEERAWRNAWHDAGSSYVAVLPENYLIRFYRLHNGTWICERDKTNATWHTYDSRPQGWGDSPSEALKRMTESTRGYSSETYPIDRLVEMVYTAWDEDVTRQSDYFGIDHCIAVEFSKQNDQWCCATYYRQGHRVHYYDEQYGERVGLAAYRQQQRLARMHEENERARQYRREKNEWFNRMEIDYGGRNTENERQDQTQKGGVVDA